MVTLLYVCIYIYIHISILHTHTYIYMHVQHSSGVMPASYSMFPVSSFKNDLPQGGVQFRLDLVQAFLNLHVPLRVHILVQQLEEKSRILALLPSFLNTMVPLVNACLEHIDHESKTNFFAELDPFSLTGQVGKIHAWGWVYISFSIYIYIGI